MSPRSELTAVNEELKAARNRAALKWSEFDRARKELRDRAQAGSIPGEAELKRGNQLNDDYQAVVSEVGRLEAKRDALLGHAIANGDTKTLSKDSGGYGLEAKPGAFLHEAKTIMTSTGFGETITPTQYAPFFIDLLTAQSVGLASGFSVLPITGSKMVIPRLTADAGADWVEEGGLIPESDPTGDQITAEPKKLAQITPLTREAFRDTNPAALAVAEHSLVRALGLGLDHGFFEGSGVDPEIRGLKNTPGIQTVSMGTNGATFASLGLDPISDAIGQIARANAQPTAIAMHPKVWQGITKLKDGQNRPLLIDHDAGPSEGFQPRIFGIPVYTTTQISTTETQGAATTASSIYVYDAPKVVAVRRQDTEVEFYANYKFQYDMGAVRVVARWDIAVPLPQAVVRIVGVL